MGERATVCVRACVCVCVPTLLARSKNIVKAGAQGSILLSSLRSWQAEQAMQLAFFTFGFGVFRPSHGYLIPIGRIPFVISLNQ